MREPVTVTAWTVVAPLEAAGVVMAGVPMVGAAGAAFPWLASWTAPPALGTVWAIAWPAPATARAPTIIVEASRRSRVDLIFNVIPSGEARQGPSPSSRFKDSR